jgi:hypothetical protein
MSGGFDMSDAQDAMRSANTAAMKAFGFQRVVLKRLTEERMNDESRVAWPGTLGDGM